MLVVRTKCVLCILYHFIPPSTMNGSQQPHKMLQLLDVFVEYYRDHADRQKFMSNVFFMDEILHDSRVFWDVGAFNERPK